MNPFEYLKTLLKSLFPEKATDIDKIAIPENQPGDAGKDGSKDKKESGDPGKDGNKDKSETPVNPPAPGTGADGGGDSKLRADLEALQQQFDTLKNSQTKEKIDLAIAEAVKNKKIAPKDEAMVKHFRALLEKDFDTATAVMKSLPEVVRDGKEQNSGSTGQASTGETGGRVRIDREALTEAIRNGMA